MIRFSRTLIRTDLAETESERKNLIESALEAGFTDIIIRKEDAALQCLARFNALLIDGTTIEYNGNRIGTLFTITNRESLEEVYTCKDSLILADIADREVIPLENLISRLQESGQQLYACVRSVEEFHLAQKIMEVGCGTAVILNTDEEAVQYRNNEQFPVVPLYEATITAVTPIPLGDRVCIDTTSILGPEEGMLIGSSSSCLFHVCSENFSSEYADARPFRVNAGAVHSYVLLPDGTTKYLAELKAGSSVAVRNNNGIIREVVVGRVKLERRPLLLIEAEYCGTTHSVILQNAETIRLLTPKGPVSVSRLQSGDIVNICPDEGGRHFGHRIAESVLEK
ncbi:MAG TPA: 3-dehydroquinate synthase II [Methanocorpusculum sp.]|nr:3-dehydroquinate synthase II [Methanocorpusculum sp.]HJJ40118.1 3-dehydroquinate synthase II [Methanocorpusculum sp.]HJJ57273.1 3-dehydroquinate synthase II [Methanocorpusculum sp.]